MFGNSTQHAIDYNLEDCLVCPCVYSQSKATCTQYFSGNKFVTK